MKTTPLITALLLLLAVTGRAQQPTSSPDKIANSGPCVSPQIPKRIKRPIVQHVAPAATEPAADFFVGEALVEVTKDQTVVRLAMAQHASVLIELPADDGPRYIIPGDPEMVTVDEKALERNKRAIIVRPGSLFVVPRSHQKRRAPAATVTAQMRSGLVVTFLFYPVTDLAQNVHRCVLSYRRDEVVARRRAAGLPVNLDQKEQGGEKPAGQSAAPSSISVEALDEEKKLNGDSSAKPGATLKTEEQQTTTPPLNPAASSAVVVRQSNTTELNDRAIRAAKDQLARASSKPGKFKNWTRPLHGLALATQQDSDLKEEFRIVLLAVKNVSAQSLKLVPGSPDLTLEMHDDKAKVINVQSIKPLHIEVSDSNNEVGVGRTVYYAIAYAPPSMGVRQRLKLVVAQADAADEPASIAFLK